MKTILNLGMGALLISSSHAANVVVNPTAISYTTTPNQEQGGLNLDNETNLINGSGLSATPTIANYTTVTHAAVNFGPGNAWATIDPGAAGGDFYAQGGIAPVFEISLGGVFQLTDFITWGYHFNTAGGNEGRAFLLEFSTDGGTSYPTSTTASVALGDYAIGNSHTMPLGGTFAADTVRMTVTDNHFGGSAPGGDRVGLAEVRFLAPEPSSALLSMLAGLMFLRRKR